MNYPLTLHHFLERARQYFPTKQIVTRTAGGIHSYTYAEFHARTHKLAHALKALGVDPGDRVATLCWNTYRHLELFFAVPCYGAVLHTLNLRLALDQLRFIINHAEDQVIFVDVSLVPLLESLETDISSVKRFVVLNDGPKTPIHLKGAVDYEDLLELAPEERYPWPRLDENDAAAMCYTTGTTGDPKGVFYSHRAIFLHSMAWAMPDAWNIGERDVVMPMMSMFHACAWGIPYVAIMVGAKLVLPGAQPQPRDLALLIQNERVTITGGVPTVWIGFHALLQEQPFDISSVHSIVSGGMSVPRSLIEAYEKDYGIRFVQIWGMTETLIDTVSRTRSSMDDWTATEQSAILARQGTPVVGVEIRVVDEEGHGVPWDGKSMGELQVRGPWVTDSLYRDERSSSVMMDGWFRTGDVAAVDKDGYIQIVDRTKDLIKSGGEWISSVDLENTIMAHPKILEAAVIAIPHPRWQERPLAVVAPRLQYQGQVTKEEILSFLEPKVAKWSLPDDVVFIDALPRTSVGKFDKKALRERYQGMVPE